MNRLASRPVTPFLLALALAGCAAQTPTGIVAVRGPEDAVPGGGAARQAPAEGQPSGAAARTVDGAIEITSELREPAGDPLAAAPAADAEMASAVRLARGHWEMARERFRAQDIEGAREAFDRALDVFTTGDLAERPEAQAVADQLLAQVSAYEAAWSEAQAGDASAEQDPAPLDVVAAVDLPEVATEPEHPAERPSSRLARDVPLEVNNQVTYMLDVYKGRLKDEILPAFERSGRYIPMIQDIFREEGVPVDLAWLALVESGFKPSAYSKAAAKGLWQFIRSTGRLYGLDSDYWTDERSDPVKATRAAARHLKDLYERYDDWYLVLAAYNAGAGKVDRAIARVGRKDYWAIASSRHLMRETKNYVPAFLATLLIVDDPKAHGFDYTPELPWSYDEVDVPGPADLTVVAHAAGVGVEEVRRLNPELRRSVTPMNQPSYRLRLPIGTRASFETAWAGIAPEERLRYATHTVQRGESLARISKRYGVRSDVLLALNGLGRGASVPPGTSIRVPMSDGYAPPSDWREDDARSRSRSRSKRGSVHVVRRGETLSGIAGRYGVSVSDLRRWNGLGSSAHIVAGSTLRVGSGGSRSQSVSKGTKSAKARPASASASARKVTHRVRRGETLTAIAGRYGVSVSDLTRWNGEGVRRNLLAGQTLQLWIQ